MTITRITTHISGPNTDGSTWTIDVQDTWDEVMNKIFPISPPSSSLEGRASIWYTKTDGNRIAITPNNVYSFEEVYVDDTD